MAADDFTGNRRQPGRDGGSVAGVDPAVGRLHHAGQGARLGGLRRVDKDGDRAVAGDGAEVFFKIGDHGDIGIIGVADVGSGVAACQVVVFSGFGVAADHGRVRDAVTVGERLDRQVAPKFIGERACAGTEQSAQQLPARRVDILLQDGADVAVKLADGHVSECYIVAGNGGAKVIEREGDIPIAGLLHGGDVGL